MSDGAVLVKTRKFMKNPLLSRRQVCWTWTVNSVLDWPVAEGLAILHLFVESSRRSSLVPLHLNESYNIYVRFVFDPYWHLFVAVLFADDCGYHSSWPTKCSQVGASRSCWRHVQSWSQADHSFRIPNKVWRRQIYWILLDLRQRRIPSQVRAQAQTNPWRIHGEEGTIS